MSEFLPDNFGQTTPSGVTQFTPSSPATTQDDVALMQRVFQAAAANPLMIPPDLMAYVLDYIQTSRLIIPIGQVFGFAGFTPQAADPVNTQETRSIATYSDLATVGPSLTDLRNGQYLIIWGASMFIPAGGPTKMGISVNGAAVDDNAACETSSAAYITTMSWVTATLSSGTNTITAQYKGDGANDGTFKNRRLVAFRFAG